MCLPPGQLFSFLGIGLVASHHYVLVVHWWATQVVKRVSDLGNQHIMVPNRIQYNYDNPSALCLALWAKNQIWLGGGGGGGERLIHPIGSSFWSEYNSPSFFSLFSFLHHLNFELKGWFTLLQLILTCWCSRCTLHHQSLTWPAGHVKKHTQCSSPSWNGLQTCARCSWGNEDPQGPPVVSSEHVTKERVSRNLLQKNVSWEHQQAKGS